MPFARIAGVALGVPVSTPATATPATAHTPSIKGGCVEGRAGPTVELSRYDGRRGNSVAVSGGGRSLEDGRFPRSFRRTRGEPGSGSKGRPFTRKVIVHTCRVPVATTAPVTIAPKNEVATVTTSTTVETTTGTTPPLTFRLPSTSVKAVVRAADQAESERSGARAGLPPALGSPLFTCGGIALVILWGRLRR
ncbi:hypothetical protein Q5530_22385 [Saccharothrix sp. BKS2]|uniref:hypothetical protein n=1 Tax=Saccharothrix sp. BKS2 TaxID=3064400 RepID=UPI0039ED1F18